MIGDGDRFEPNCAAILQRNLLLHNKSTEQRMNKFMHNTVQKNPGKPLQYVTTVTTVTRSRNRNYDLMASDRDYLAHTQAWEFHFRV